MFYDPADLKWFGPEPECTVQQPLCASLCRALYVSQGFPRWFAEAFLTVSFTRCAQPEGDVPACDIVSDGIYLFTFFFPLFFHYVFYLFALF